MSESRLIVGSQVGDYLLKELLHDDDTMRSWLAEQVSVRRDVIVDSLTREKQSDPAIVETFLSDIRAKAQVDHPLIGSVFEAIHQEPICLYAREHLRGQTLLELQEEGAQLPPLKVIVIIRQLSEANLHLESNKIASLPLQAEQIFISKQFLCRIVNMAVGGERDHQVSTHDKHLIASLLIPLLIPNEPGSTRTRSLLDFMADLEREIPLTWEQIHDLASEVEHQLVSSPTTPSLPSSTMKLKRPGIGRPLLITLGALLGVGLSFFVYTFISNTEPPSKPRTLTHLIHVPANSYPTHDGGQLQHREFWIDAYEVSIAEYAAFLKTLDTLGPEQASIYEHEQQPDSKTDHIPDDWDAMYQAARSNGIWNGQTVDLNCPVVGVDWWDAYTYASHMGRRLPSQEEWHAALSASASSAALQTSHWGPVDQDGTDLTASGIHGLAGNVSEWTRELERNHAAPTKPKMAVLCGGSYKKTHFNATSREWLDPSDFPDRDTRSLRRSDLGFRTITDKKPE